jgi:hypothetical protein
MKRTWILAGAALVTAGFLALPAPAQETVKSPSKTVSTVETIQTTPRSGLLRRLLRRDTVVVTESAPVTKSETTQTQTPSKVQQAQAIQPAQTQTQAMETREVRGGILSRLRSRFGRY